MNGMTDIERRAEKAYRAALRYSDGETEDTETDITDLLCDLLHLADEYGGSEDFLQRALLHYEAERKEMAA